MASKLLIQSDPNQREKQILLLLNIVNIKSSTISYNLMEFDLRLIDVDLHHKAVLNTRFQALGCRRAALEYSMNTIIL